MSIDTDVNTEKDVERDTDIDLEDLEGGTHIQYTGHNDRDLGGIVLGMWVSNEHKIVIRVHCDQKRENEQISLRQITDIQRG